MNTAGLWMLAALGVLVVTTGLPVWALLLGVAGAAAGLGLAFGRFEPGVLAALGPRITSLLDHDLLQAMPLYVFVGVLALRLPVADALFGGAAALLRRTGTGRPLAALAVGTLVAPMNGSVASSSALLSRIVAPRLGTVAPARALALVSAAATIGVVVPPSLVLILLGDAMLRAHTEASNLASAALAGQRIVNTQDVLHAALLPALAVLLLWALATWWRYRGSEEKRPAERMGTARAAIALIATTVVVLLLAGVFTGRLFAVEAAATGGCLLAAGALATRSLSRRAWQEVLDETLALSGALFALLVGATTFSLVFRIFGTDRWLADTVLASPWPPQATALAVLLLVAACAWVLDAFEMIFVVIPILAPLLIVQLGDAQQVAVLLLLVLQASFLLPPMGYALLMVRSRAGLPAPGTRELLLALAPFLGAIVLVAAAVFAWPRAVHLLDAPAAAAADAKPAMSEDDIAKQMREMAPSEAEPAAEEKTPSK